MFRFFYLPTSITSIPQTAIRLPPVDNHVGKY